MQNILGNAINRAHYRIVGDFSFFGSVVDEGVLRRVEINDSAFKDPAVLQNNRMRSRSRSCCCIDQHLIPLDSLTKSLPHVLRRIRDNLYPASKLPLEIYGYFVEHAEGHARTAQETQVNIARRPLLASSERTEKISLAHIIVSKDSRNYAGYMFDR